MKRSHHVIGKQIVEVSLTKEDAASGLQDRISTLCDNRLAHLFDELFSHYSSHERTICIDRLELDLGTIDPIWLEDEIYEKVLTLLPEKLSGALNPSRNRGTIKDALARDFDRLNHFLHLGRLPWWSVREDRWDVEELIEELLEKKPELVKSLIVQTAGNKQQARRLVNTISISLTERLFTLLKPRLAGEVIELAKTLAALLTELAPGPGNKETAVWTEVMAYFSSGPTGSYTQPLIRGAIQEVLLDTGGDFDSLYQKVCRKAAEAGIKGIKPSEFGGKTGPAAVNLLTKVKNLIKLYRESGSLVSGLEALARDIRENRNTADLTGYEKRLNTLLESAGGQIIGAEEGELTEEIYIDNAGLVILWPYLSRLFENLALIRENNFCNRAACNKAVLILDYLARGQEGKTDEALCVLNKLLCGIDPEKSIDTGLKLDKKEAHACEKLLEAVIFNWQALNDTGPDGLRGMFLLRQGVLKEREGTILLQVEDKPFDILLNKMKWGFGTIKLPWMKKIISVEWRS